MRFDVFTVGKTPSLWGKWLNNLFKKNRSNEI